MRRIPRPQRAIDPSLPLVRPRVSPSPCTHLRNTTAAFSTSSSQSFLLSGKQDKKKHQQFVRRWQKRLLGDSEPIGAHVDPYDPTSPVRIAPEEHGEEVEVIEEDAHADAQFYQPAEISSRMYHVGGKQWQAQMHESNLAKEFEKMTMRTYTPLSLGMANEIEDLTGTPYTLRDENLLLAQRVHEVTGKPYTDLNFGVAKRVTDAEFYRLRNSFRQAVAEIYTLHQAKLDMDVSKFTNRGLYQAPKWVKEIKLHQTESGQLALSFPSGQNAESFLEVMQQAPEWDGYEVQENLDEEPLFEVDGMAYSNESQVPEQPVPVIDPAIPPERRAAVVKQDEDKKPFDFMSNRPVPRKPTIKTPQVEGAADPSSAPSVSAALDSNAASDTPQPVVLEPPAPATEKKAPAPEKTNAASVVTPVGEAATSAAVDGPEAKWRHVPLTDPAIKFALFKRLLQLTGVRVSDPQLTTANTLGDIYGYLCDAIKPRPATLFQKLHVGGQKARERANRSEGVDAEAAEKKADLGDLITLGNVELRRKAPTNQEKRTKTGLDKVIQYALAERGLGGRGPRKIKQRKPNSARVIEGTRRVPEFGQPVSGRAASYLAEKTAEIRKRAEKEGLNA